MSVLSFLYVLIGFWLRKRDQNQGAGYFSGGSARACLLARRGKPAGFDGCAAGRVLQLECTELSRTVEPSRRNGRARAGSTCALLHEPRVCHARAAYGAAWGEPGPAGPARRRIL